MNELDKLTALLSDIAVYFKECRQNASFASRSENHFWEMQNAASEAVELLKTQKPQTVNGWVSVKDRLPEDTKQKIVFHKRGVSFAYFSGNYWWSSIGGRHSLDTVTHWMPLPEPPEEGLE